jgi:hypothetical protein
MRNDYCCHIGYLVFQGTQRLPLREQVERRGGLVKDEDPRTQKPNPGQRDKLALARREPSPQVTDVRVVAIGKFRDEVSRSHRFGR